MKIESEKFACPECGETMDLKPDPIAKDWYIQCRNRRCGFDGAYGETPEQAAINAGCKTTVQ